MMIRVKICGNRDQHDVTIAVDSGADAVGFIVGVKYDSEDAITPAEACALSASLPPFVSSVLVTHLQSSAEVLELYRQVKPSTIQLHNAMSLDALRDVRSCLENVKLIKAVHVVDATAVEEAVAYSSFVDAVLLDSRTGNRIGGTGQTHDWSISREVVIRCPVPVILAGGLHPGNILQALSEVRPYGIDVNSGVDAMDGSKDAVQTSQFVCRAKMVERSWPSTY